MIIATNNKGKISEIKKIFKDFDLYSLKDKDIHVDVEEDQDTFIGNALKKATEINKITGEAVIADDSGLCIDVLAGYPGVMTHRFLGDDASDDDRNNYLINKVNEFDTRDASVVCNLVFFDGVHTVVGEGVLRGKIATNRRGENGFGFDDIFELPNGKTLAELTPDEKNEVSARSLAAKDLLEKLNNVFVERAN